MPIHRSVIGVTTIADIRPLNARTSPKQRLNPIEVPIILADRSTLKGIIKIPKKNSPANITNTYRTFSTNFTSKKEIISDNIINQIYNI